MRDLYSKIGLDETASIEQIKIAIRNKTLTQDDANDIEYVLLNSERRRAYDRLHRTLKTIGILRSEQNRLSTENWNKSDYWDYTPFKSSGKYTKYVHKRNEPASSSENTLAKELHLKGVAVTAAIIFALFVLLNSPDDDGALTKKNNVGGGAPSSDQLQTSRSRNYDDLSDLNRRGICELQERLMGSGFYTSAVDGVVGNATKNALNAYVAKHSMHWDGKYTMGMLQHVRDHSNSSTYNNINFNNPRNGAVMYNGDKNSIAPFKVVTNQGSYDYFVKMKDAYSGKLEKSFYIGGGLTIQTKMPLGNYRMEYAAGERWFGENCYFGLNTTYAKADSVMEFTMQGNRIQGHVVELILQTDGNLRTSTISADSF